MISSSAPQNLLWGNQAPQLFVESSGKAWFTYINKEVLPSPSESPSFLYSDDSGTLTQVLSLGNARQGPFLVEENHNLHVMYVPQSGNLVHKAYNTLYNTTENIDTSVVSDKNYYFTIHKDVVSSNIYFASRRFNMNTMRIAQYSTRFNKWYPPNSVPINGNEGIYPALTSFGHRIFVQFAQQPNVVNTSVDRQRVVTSELSYYGKQHISNYVNHKNNDGNTNSMSQGIASLNGNVYGLQSSRALPVGNSVAQIQAAEKQDSKITIIRNGSFAGVHYPPTKAQSSNLGVFDNKLWVYHEGGFFSSEDGASWLLEHTIDVSSYDKTRVHFPDQNYSSSLTVLFATRNSSGQTLQVLRL